MQAEERAMSALLESYRSDDNRYLHEYISVERSLLPTHRLAVPLWAAKQ